MSCTEILEARVSLDIKSQAKAAAERELLSEAAWLKRIVMNEVRSACGAKTKEHVTGRADNDRKADRGGRGSAAPADRYLCGCATKTGCCWMLAPKAAVYGRPRMHQFCFARTCASSPRSPATNY